MEVEPAMQNEKPEHWKPPPIKIGGSFIFLIKEAVMQSELYHHGILGQRWGIRRYQNEDGTLTAAGKKKT